MSSLIQNYRTSAESKEILRLLQRSGTIEGNFFWQSLATGKRIIPITHIEIDFVARDVKVVFESQKFDLDVAQIIFVKLETNQTVFKVKDFTYNNGELHFAIPDEVKTLEHRIEKRLVVPPTREKTLCLRAVQSNSTTQELKVKAVDISYDGLGICVSETNRSFIRHNRILWLTELNGNELRHPILAEVVYIQSHAAHFRSLGKGHELRVGLKLSAAIPQQAFQQFLN